MSSLTDQHRKALLEAVTPSRADVVVAKRDLLNEVTSRPRVLYELLTAGLGPDKPPSRHDAIDLDSHADFRHVSRLAWLRHVAARSWALFELERTGIVMPVVNVEDGRRVSWHLPWTLRGTSSGIDLDLPLPPLNPGYMRSHDATSAGGHAGVLDRDLFLDELPDWAAFARTFECLDEALECRAAGRWFACASLLGAFVEGAWANSGRCLGTVKILSALDSPTTGIAKAQDLILAELENRGTRKYLVDQLRAFAAMMRRIRNYGVHVDAPADAALQTAFTEEGASLLVLQTHQHLVELTDTVAEVSED